MDTPHTLVLENLRMRIWKTQWQKNNFGLEGGEFCDTLRLYPYTPSYKFATVCFGAVFWSLIRLRMTSFPIPSSVTRISYPFKLIVGFLKLYRDSMGCLNSKQLVQKKSHFDRRYMMKWPTVHYYLEIKENDWWILLSLNSTVHSRVKWDAVNFLQKSVI